VVFVSAKSSPAYIQHGLACGAVDYIAKPFDLPLLLDKIEQITSALRRLRPGRPGSGLLPWPGRARPSATRTRASASPASSGNAATPTDTVTARPAARGVDERVDDDALAQLVGHLRGVQLGRVDQHHGELLAAVAGARSR
jgi:DNA-binding response OmpR family regulator